MDAIEKAREFLIFSETHMRPDAGGLWLFADAFSAKAAEDAFIPNTVCLPLGAEDCSGLRECEGFIRQFPHMLIVPHNDAEWDKMVGGIRELVSYIPLLVPNKARFRGCRTVEELYKKHGAEAVSRLIDDPIELPAYGLLDIADVTPIDVTRLPRTLSGIYELDRATGGFLMGEVSIWTGKRGSGKSTFLGQMLLEARDRGRKVCAYSGELSDWRFKDWLYLQAAGPPHILSTMDEESGRELHQVNAFAYGEIDKWLRARLWLYDLRISTAHDTDSIMQLFEYAARRYGCTVFLVDNIMTARFKGVSDDNFYRQQSNFVGRLLEFAKRFNVHVHVVAHPRKGEIRDGDDVSGTGDITNRADNVYLVERLPDAEANVQEFDALLTVMKNRAYGERAKIKLCFEPKSRRFYKALTGNPNKRYGWDKEPVQTGFSEIPDGEAPF